MSETFIKYQDSWVGSNSVVVNNVSFMSLILPSSTASLPWELDDERIVYSLKSASWDLLNLIDIRFNP